MSAVFGIRNAMGSRYSDETVLLVRSIYKRNSFGYREIEKLTGIPNTTIRQWVNRTNRDEAGRSAQP